MHTTPHAANLALNADEGLKLYRWLTRSDGLGPSAQPQAISLRGVLLLTTICVKSNRV